jgi:hypothetical protein
MKIIDKFTKSEEKKQRRRKLFTFSNPHTRHHLLHQRLQNCFIGAIYQAIGVQNKTGQQAIYLFH